MTLDSGIFSMRHLCKALARSFSERLTFLRGVDTGNPNLVLALGVIQNRDGVAVRDADDTAGDGPGFGSRGRVNCGESENREQVAGTDVMELEGVGVTQPNRITYQVRFKFGKQAYCVIEVRRGEDAADIAKKLRELAAQVEARSK